MDPYSSQYNTNTIKSTLQPLNVNEHTMQGRIQVPIFAPPPEIDNTAKIDDILSEIVFGEDGVNMYGSFPMQTAPISALSSHSLTAESHQQFLKQIQSSAQQFATETPAPVQPTQRIHIQQPLVLPAVPVVQSVPQPIGHKRPRPTAIDDNGSNSFQTLQGKIQNTPNVEDIAILVRKERNKEHAKRSRTRKKFLLDSFQFSLDMLSKENEKLSKAIIDAIGEEDAEKEFEALKNFRSEDAFDPLAMTDPTKDNTSGLCQEDAGLVNSLQRAEFSFVITNPSIPDNPIVFASSGFLKLTGYQLHQVLGRNCRFLQGPDTNPATVEKLRTAVKEGKDASVCILNYTADGQTFWNQLYLSPLMDSENQVVNFVGVQCKVPEEVAKEMKQEV